jgi:hypothetical protein
MKLKQNISKQTIESEQLSPVLEELRKEAPGFKVPDGYFDSLSPRIVDSIKKQESRSIFKTLVPSLRKPLVWAPAMASVVVVLLLVFAVPSKKTSTIPVIDEWTELNMAYDESYAAEVYLSESSIIDNELENKDVNYIAATTILAKSEPTLDEITEYLKDQDIDTDILNEY